jgi:hypothetical protein
MTSTKEEKAAPLAGLRWTLALLIVLAWLGCFGYWLVSGTQPACQVTTITQTHPTKTTVTRSCGLPDATDYVYVLGAVALLLLPDAESISVGGLGFRRRFSQLAGAANVADAARKGDTPNDTEPAQAVLGQLLLDMDTLSGQAPQDQSGAV